MIVDRYQIWNLGHAIDLNFLKPLLSTNLKGSSIVTIIQAKPFLVVFQTSNLWYYVPLIHPYFAKPIGLVHYDYQCYYDFGCISSCDISLIQYYFSFHHKIFFSTIITSTFFCTLIINKFSTVIPNFWPCHHDFPFRPFSTLNIDKRSLELFGLNSVFHISEDWNKLSNISVKVSINLIFRIIELN